MRKDNTVLAAREEYEVPGHHGIWIDIFPIDKVPTSKLAKSRMFFFSAIRLLYTRNYSANKTSGVINAISKILLRLPKYIKKSIKKYSDKYVTKFCNRDKDYFYIEFTSFSALRRYYPSDLFTEYTQIKFEGYSFKIVKD